MPDSLDRASHRSETAPISGTVTRYCKGRDGQGNMGTLQGEGNNLGVGGVIGAEALSEAVHGEVRAQMSQ